MGRVWITAALAASMAACGEDDGMPMPDASTACTTDMDCDDGAFCTGVETCDGAGRCVAGTPPCPAGTTCDEAGDRCATDCGTDTDADGDGIDSTDCGGTDCDDTDPGRYPGNPEICDSDAVDEDCEPTTIGERDIDGDGYDSSICCNGDDCGMDCNDLLAAVSPAGTEACDGVDNDCDDLTDESVLVSGFADADRDLHGDPSTPIDACPGHSGWSAVDDDCDDADPSVHGAQVEICDEKDNDCDTRTDESAVAVPWYRDADGDGFGTSNDVVTSCVPVPGRSLLSTDCDDADIGRSPAATELCNGVDDDCNGRLDAPVADGGGLEDDDMDGFVDADCTTGTDCDDHDPAVHPSAVELCDAIDNDCDGTGDDGSTDVDWYPDVDGDGWGNDAGPVVRACAAPRGHVGRPGDCSDSSPAVSPGLPDTSCDGIDQDCDDTVDEGAVRVGWYDDSDGDGDAGGDAVIACEEPGAGWSRAAADCDDADDAIQPGATETCDGVDEDCDYTADEGLGMSVTCGVGACMRTVNTCMGGMSMTCSPGTAGSEVCDGTTTDEDCDGRVDEEPAASASCSFGGTAIGACSSGSCTIVSCIGSNLDCNGSATDGCEVDVSTDETSCGSCGHRCGATSTCTAGRCSHEPIDMDAGQFHTCAVLGDGTVWCWGRNESGQLGDGSMMTRTTAVQVMGITDARGVGTGLSHTCVVHATGTLSCWGLSDFRQLGINRTAPSTMPLANAGGVTGAVEVHLGARSSCARAASGPIWCFGESANSQLGAGCGSVSCFGAVQVNPAGLPSASLFDTGDAHSLAKRASPTEARAWGDGADGALGHGLFIDQLNVAVQTDEPGNPNVLDATSLAAGRGVSCLARSDGSVWCTGRNDLGQLGSGATGPDVNRFQQVPGLTGTVQVEAGYDTVCTLDTTNQLRCWGRNDQNQVGMGAGGPMAVTSPSLATIVPTGALRVAIGEQHVCAVLPSHTVVCWGDNSFGQLGNGGTMSSATAQIVRDLPAP